VKRLLIALAGAIVALPVVVAPPAQAASYVPVSGAGSTWSANAMDQWRRNVNQYGMRIDFQASGSSDGRNQFRNGTVDFAVSEIPYGLKDGNVVDFPPNRPFAYMPIVAGGTAFMYNLKIGAKRVSALRLSGETLAKIFTGKITVWNDPQILKENPGLRLTARKIVPVVRGDGSGTTAQFSAFMASEYASIWNAYCAEAGRQTPCGTTSIYPVVAGKGFTAQAGSLGVSGYVSQEQNEGTITYVEYSYAINAGFPVVKVLNRAGYYVAPTAENVAVGLLKATINNDPKSPAYLTQNLSGVYRHPDKRAYPLSSYSYMVVPTATTKKFTEAKGQSLGKFAYYFLCEGQQQAARLGFSPLPINLVKAGLAQVKRIPGAAAENIDIKNCNNPTFSSDGSNTLADNAPFPPACDQAGPLQCGTNKEGSGGGGSGSGSGSGGSGSGSGSGSESGSGGSGSGSGSGSGGGGTGTGGGGTGTDGGSGSGGDTGGAATVVDPETGQVVSSGGGDGTELASDAYPVPISTSADSSVGNSGLLVLLALTILLAAVAVPPLISRRGQT